MEEVIYYNNLYDIYGDLLTDKQRDYFEEYYFNNLSLGEISFKFDVSRNAVFNQLKITVNKLISYEETLNVFKKKCKLTKIIESIEDVKLREELLKVL